MPAISRKLLVPFSCQQMYDLVDGIEYYPDFVPWCSDTQIVSRSGDTVTASITVTAAGVYKTFTTRNLCQPSKMMEIRLVDGPFSHLEGFWRFDAEGEAQCLVSFDLEFAVSGWLNYAFSPLFQQMANSLVDAFHKRALDVYD